MKILVTEDWIKTIEEYRKKDPYYDTLLKKGLFEGIPELLEHESFYVPEEGQDFWRSVGKVRNAALAYRLGDKTPGLREWLHRAVMEFVDMDDDMWIGPFFRARTNPPEGALETGIILEVLAIILMTCPDILNPDETKKLLKQVKEVGAPYCLNWMETKDREGLFEANNWSIQLLDGYSCSALILEDEEMLQYVVEHYNRLAIGTMNSDFYGEPVGYWAYPAAQFSTVSLMMHAYRPDLYEKMASAEEFARSLPWAIAQRIGTYEPEALSGIKVTRCANFSDSDAMDRMTPVALTGIAILLKEKNPALASLAASVVEKEYTPENMRLPNSGKLGFYPYPDFWLYLYYPFFPEKKDIGGLVKKTGPQRFEDGVTVYRNNKIFIAVNGGSLEPPKVMNHRHADQSTFEVAYDNVVLLDDPGRCCYRLPGYYRAKEDVVHTLPFFQMNGEYLHQVIQEHEYANLPPMNKDLGYELSDEKIYITNDTSALYPEPMKTVQRTFTAIEDHIILLKDRYEAAEEVTAGVRFVLNNRMMKMKWFLKPGEGKAVREGVGVRIISLEEITPTLGYGTLHDMNHVNPGGPTQGREGSAYEFLFDFSAKKRNGAGLYEGISNMLLIADDEEKLDLWKLEKEDGKVTVSSPENRIYELKI